MTNLAGSRVSSPVTLEFRSEGVTLGDMLPPEVTHRIGSTYAALTDGQGPPTFQQEFSTFLLALDLSGQSRFATWVWEMVSIALRARGESYAQGWLDNFAGPVLGMESKNS